LTIFAVVVEGEGGGKKREGIGHELIRNVGTGEKEMGLSDRGEKKKKGEGKDAWNRRPSLRAKKRREVRPGGRHVVCLKKKDKKRGKEGRS